MLELSTKQLESYRDSDARINLWIGSVRSGKSFVANLSFLKFVREAEPKNMDMIILGRSQQAIKRNIVNPLVQFLGSRIEYYSGKQELQIGNRTVHVIGANDERAASKIQGSTFLGALVDEITILPESVWNMLLSRLSPAGARLYGTSNPDSPYHWLKTNFIDRASELNLKHWDFDFTDNPSLSQEYINNLKREYTGLWYQRYIEGKWVLAEGAVYDFFNEKTDIIEFPPGQAEEYTVGIDYGTTNPCAFVMVGYSTQTQPNRWIEKEYYYDSQKAMRQKSDSEYAADLAKFISGYNVRGIFIDPSAVSLRVELRHVGISNVFEANNDVLNGIRYVTDLLTNGTLKVCVSCKNTISEIGTYVWDQKAAQKGIEKPLKINDHCLDALRYCLFSHYFNRPHTRVKPEDLDHWYNESRGIHPNMPKFLTQPGEIY